MNTQVYDYIGVGVGPFNLGLSCLADPIENLNGIFFDKSEGFDWHPGMMLQDATLQIPFMADLVTLADPTSEYSFLNYIKEQRKMYSFYIRESFYLLRQEYNQYCQWAIKKLGNTIRFNTFVDQIDYNEEGQYYVVTTICTITDEINTYRAKHIVLGTGTTPYIPKSCEALKDKGAIHSSSYLNNKAKLQQKKAITVVGSGQSAAEIFYDLLQEIDTYNYQLNWITRSPRFFPLEYTKLTLEMTSPEYVDYFYDLPEEKRTHLIANQKHLYKGINQDLINDIFDLLYTKNVYGKLDVNLRTNSTLKVASFNDATQAFDLVLHQHEQDKYYRHSTEGLVLSTGYQYQMPEFIEGIRHRIKWDEKGRFDVARNYSIDQNESEIFVQNVELHTHGFVTPDLGMASYKNSKIIESITGTPHYLVENKIAFQQFEVNKAEEIPAINTLKTV